MTTNLQENSQNNGDQILQDSPDDKWIFKKRAGTTPKGTDYENLYMANLILKLVNDDEVENFYLSSNDERFGCFDDVVVEIERKGRKETIAIQLKHVDKKKLHGKKLDADEGNFSIKKYNEAFTNKLKTLKPPVKTVLLTNSKLSSTQCQLGEMMKCEENELIGRSDLRGCCHRFEANEKNSEEYEIFFRNFYLYTDQQNVDELRECVYKTFIKRFNSDDTAFREYLHFITQWSSKEGKKHKLDKKWMTDVIALCVFAPFVKPLAFSNEGDVDQKRQLFREAVSKRDFTVVETNHFANFESAWIDLVNNVGDLKEVNLVNQKYQIMGSWIGTKESLYVENRVQVSKLMWLLKRAPLVVLGSKQVYQTIKKCKTRNLIILDDAEKFNRNLKSSDEQMLLFDKLSDLKEEGQLYYKIINCFTYSLEGQRASELKHLLEICKDVDNSISTNDIVQMLEGPLMIGKHKEVLPPSHIERKITKIVIHIDFLKKKSNTTNVLVTCVTDDTFFKKKVFQSIPVQKINNLDKIQNTTLGCKIYVCENQVSRKQFNAFCKNNPQMQFHHFRYLGTEYLEWIQSENFGEKQSYLDGIRKYRVEDESDEFTVPESEFFKDAEQDINIICADPGMGKTTLMKSLKNGTSSARWTIVIYARNHAEHFTQAESNLEKFVNYMLEKTCKELIKWHKNIFKTMVAQNRIQLVWDGLDEASETTQSAIVELVKNFPHKEVKQWLTSRKNLKEFFENRLGIFSRNIKEFDDKDQKEYIKDRLNLGSDELSITFSKIKTNILSFPNFEILGIPLQIYMLTELLISNEEYIKSLEDSFTVLYLYEYFVEEKFKVLFQAKNDFKLSKEKVNQDFENKKKERLIFYKHLAARSYFNTSLFQRITSNLHRSSQNIQICLKTIINEGDDVGIISRITSIDNVEFSHNSYGEYFAALYLYENNKSKTREKNFISNDRYKNIRFFLDLMLTRNLKGFTAVVYKNPSLLEKCTKADLIEIDCIGRDVLEVSCAWNKSDAVLNTELLLSHISTFEKYSLLDYKWKTYSGENTYNLTYADVRTFYKIKHLLDDYFNKLLLFFPDLIRFYGKLGFKEEYSFEVLQYAIRFDFPMIFECIDRSTTLKTAYSAIDPWALLSLALHFGSTRISEVIILRHEEYFLWEYITNQNFSRSRTDEILSALLQFQEFKTNIPNLKGDFLIHYALDNDLDKTLSALLQRDINVNVTNKSGSQPIHYACKSTKEKALEIVKMLLAKGAETNVPDGDGRLPMYYACQNERYVQTMVELLLENGAEVNDPDGNGRLPLHCACQIKNDIAITIVQLLLTNGAKVDVPDGDGRLPMHYACQNKCWNTLETVKILLANGAKVDVPDRDGRLPMYYACKHGWKDTVNLLLANGAKMDVPDGDGGLPMHYACQNLYYSEEIIKLLLANGARVDVPDGDGRLPMHYACQNQYYSEEIIKLLLANGAKVDVPDRDGRLPIHYACQNNCENAPEIIKLLLANGAKMDAPDGDGRLPMHYACERTLSFIKLLLANGANVDDPDRDGADALCLSK